jgi:hypothetical protein
MNYAIQTTENFERKIKRLAKKYRSMTNNLESFKTDLLKNPKMGDDLGNNTRKIRITIESKNKGKSGGARVITYNMLVSVEDTDIYLLTIYDKSEQDNISAKKITQLKRECGLI